MRLPVYSLPLTILFIFLLLVLRYFFLSFFLWWMVRSHSSCSKAQVFRDIRWSLGSTLVFTLIVVFLIRMVQWGWSKIYLDMGDYPLWYLPVSLIIYLVIQDTYFYWTHRLLHQEWFRFLHRADHESTSPSAFTSFAFHPGEALIQGMLLPLLIFLIPIHAGVFALFLLIMSVFGVTNHLGVEIYPSSLEKRWGIITATHHQIHHRQFHKNFGLFFTFWDHLMGTESR